MKNLNQLIEKAIELQANQIDLFESNFIFSDNRSQKDLLTVPAEIELQEGFYNQNCEQISKSEFKELKMNQGHKGIYTTFFKIENEKYPQVFITLAK